MDIAVPFLSRRATTASCGTTLRSPASAIPSPIRFAGGAGDGLTVTGDDGTAGWTATYFVGERQVALPRTSRDRLPDISTTGRNGRPARRDRRAEHRRQRVPDAARRLDRQRTRRATAALHKFRLYSSSYVKVFADGKRGARAAGGRTGTPGTTISSSSSTAGKPVELRIEWEPNQGYIALLPRRSAARGRPPLAVSFASEARQGDRLLRRRRRRHGRGRSPAIAR